MFISPALAADAASAAPSAAGFAQMLPIFLILGVFYFLVIRPQNARIRSHRAMVDALKKGDKVVTGGGLVAHVAKAQEKNDEITLKLADGVEVIALRSSISALHAPKEKDAKEAKK